MTDKQFHTTNNEGLLSDTFVDLLYTVMKGDDRYKISPDAKKALEDSIKRGKTVTVDAVSGGISVQNDLGGS